MLSISNIRNIKNTQARFKKFWVRDLPGICYDIKGASVGGYDKGGWWTDEWFKHLPRIHYRYSVVPDTDYFENEKNSSAIILLSYESDANAIKLNHTHTAIARLTFATGD